jgi:hypothetical protein
MKRSVMGACGEAALSAGCESMMLAEVKNPGYEMPHMPAFPLLLGTFLSSQSMLS